MAGRAAQSDLGQSDLGQSDPGQSDEVGHLLGDRYLVAPRGETQWVRNLRVAGAGELHLGRRIEPFAATEIADRDKPAVLRAYLARWKFEVGVFFDGIGPDAPEPDRHRIAPDTPSSGSPPGRRNRIQRVWRG